MTTGWMWETIQRKIDEIVVGGVTYQRNNWRLIRFRRSNAAYASQLGETATALSAENGGVTETIDSPTINALSFAMTGFEGYIDVSGAGSATANGRHVRGDDVSGSPAWYQEGGGSGFQDAIVWGGSTASNWRLYDSNINIYDSAVCAVTDAPYSAAATPWVNDGGTLPVPTLTAAGGLWAVDGGVWVPSSNLRNSQPVFIQYKTANFPLGKTNVVWFSQTGTTSGLWCAAPVSDDLAASGGFEDEAIAANYPDGFAIASSGGMDLNGKTLEGQDNWDTNDGVATRGPTQVDLTCIGDDQPYPNQYVDYYRQVQTWEYIDGYHPVT